MNSKLQRIADMILENQYEKSGHIYHPLPFPEFQHLRVSSNPKAAFYQWESIKRVLDLKSDPINFRVLDIGANAGFYSFKFAQLGASVDAYEPHEHYSDLGQQIVEATDLPVTWHNKVLEEEDIAGKEYDISLMLSVFQWMSSGNEKLENATSLLHDIAGVSRYLFFSLGCNQGKSAIHIDKQPLRWVWKLLNDTTYPKRVYYLGNLKPWKGNRRYIFACTQESIVLTIWQKFVTRFLNIIWKGHSKA